MTPTVANDLLKAARRARAYLRNPLSENHAEVLAQLDAAVSAADAGNPGEVEQQAHARATDPRTSHAAAARVSKKLTSIQQHVLSLFEVHGEMTDLDLQAICGTPGSTHRTRRSELVDRGIIRDSGRVKYQRGSNRTIWELVR